jgi:hypothetical protein
MRDFLAPIRAFHSPETHASKTPTAPQARTDSASAHRPSGRLTLAPGKRFSIARQSARTTSASSTPTAIRASLATAVSRISTALRTSACRRATAPSTRTAHPPASAHRASCPPRRRTSVSFAARRMTRASTMWIAHLVAVQSSPRAASTQPAESGAASRSPRGCEGCDDGRVATSAGLRVDRVCPRVHSLERVVPDSCPRPFC